MRWQLPWGRKKRGDRGERWGRSSPPSLKVAPIQIATQTDLCFSYTAKNHMFSLAFANIASHISQRFSVLPSALSQELLLSLPLSLSLSLSTSLLALFECVRPCRWLLKVKVSPIFHAICLGLAMWSLSLWVVRSRLSSLCCELHNTNRGKVKARVTKKENVKEKQKKKKKRIRVQGLA